MTPSARIRPAALAAQMVRVGVRSIPVIVLVQNYLVAANLGGMPTAVRVGLFDQTICVAN